MLATLSGPHHVRRAGSARPRSVAARPALVPSCPGGSPPAAAWPSPCAVATPRGVRTVAGMRVRKAVIPAAGLGTRFLPATKATPKEMIPLVDKPGIQYVVEEAVAAGIEDILIVTGRSKKTVEDHFDRSPELEATLAGQRQGRGAGRDPGHQPDGPRPLRPPGRAAWARSRRRHGPLPRRRRALRRAPPGRSHGRGLDAPRGHDHRLRGHRRVGRRAEALRSGPDQLVRRGRAGRTRRRPRATSPSPAWSRSRRPRRRRATSPSWAATC